MTLPLWSRLQRHTDQQTDREYSTQTKHGKPAFIGSKNAANILHPDEKK